MWSLRARIDKPNSVINDGTSIVELPFITGSKPTARAVCTSLSVVIGLLAAMSAAEAQTSDSVEIYQFLPAALS